MPAATHATAKTSAIATVQPSAQITPPLAPIRQEAYTTALDKMRGGLREMLRAKLLEGGEADSPPCRSSLHAVAEAVEAAAHAWAHAQPGDATKSYMAKSKTLVFNLKKNDALRGQVRRGEVTAPHLVQMDVNELADASIVAERVAAEKKLADEVALDYSRRADVVAAKRKVGLVPFMLLSAGGRVAGFGGWVRFLYFCLMWCTLVTHFSFSGLWGYTSMSRCVTSHKWCR